VKSQNNVERHPLEPFLPTDARLLMLGSFPPAQSRWSMNFFYPNFINDMWRIYGIVFFGDREHFVNQKAKCFKRDELIRFLKEKGVALYDTATAIVRTAGTASDKDLQVVEATDLHALLKRIPSCKAMVTTGEKATNLFTSQFNMHQPKVGGWEAFSFEGRSMRLYRMPSSSRAYPMRLERKAEIYRPMLLEVLGN
jgi:G:T/U-mismatch repair DNA glycosylase